jgi:signal transduction histidine kinase
VRIAAWFGFNDWGMRRKIGVIVGVPCAVALLGMALTVPRSIASYQRATGLRASNAATDNLIVAASEQAKERGFTTSLLSSAASRELKPRVLELRGRGDLPLDVALTATAMIADSNPLLRRSRRELLELRHLRDMLRTEVDAAAGSYPAPAGLIPRWFDAQTALIEAEDRYMRALFVAQNPYELIVQYNTYIKRSVFLASEFAGRERAMLANAIASGQPISAATQTHLSQWRGVVEENLDAIRQLKTNPDMPQSLVNAIGVMEQRFLGPFEAVRQAVYAASRRTETGAATNYPLSPPQWIGEATRAIDSVIAVSASISQSADAVSAQQTHESLHNLGVLVLMFGVLMAAVLASVRVARATAQPLLLLRDAARDFEANGGHHSLPPFPAFTQGDEVGQVSRSFAEMAARVRDSLSLLATEKQAVEARVQERTAQLREQQTYAEQLAHTLAQQNDKLGSANAYLIELNAERNSFLNLCTHELKSPLVSQIALMDLLRDEPNARERERLIERLDASTARMLTLVQNLLQVSALEIAAHRFTNGAVDLTGAVHEALALNAARARVKHIALHWEPADDAATHRIVGDRDAVVQVADNLLSNAIKFSRPGSAVHIRTDRAGDALRMVVQDQGPGIAQDELPMLFRKFAKISPRPTDGESSTGLGLAIVRQLATGMGAEVSCTSVLGKGSAFTVRFRTLVMTVAMSASSTQASESSTQGGLDAAAA